MKFAAALVSACILANTGVCYAETYQEAAEIFGQVYRNQGMDGLEDYVPDCYRKARASKNIEQMRICLAVDVAAVNFDEVGIRRFGPEVGSKYFNRSVMFARASRMLAEIGIERDRHGPYLIDMQDKVLSALSR